MSKTEFKKMLISLAQNYNTDLSKQRLEAITALCEQTIGFGFDWQEVTKQIATEETFFPNMAVIKKYAFKSSLLQSPRQCAVEYVDLLISALNAPRPFEVMSEYDLSYAKNKLNVDHFAVRSGQITPGFMRKQWIEIVEADFIREREKERSELLCGESKQLEASHD